MIAALFVELGGAYSGLSNVEVWDITRDARKYAGPHRVIAHPPCQRWGRYWSGGPSATVKRIKGDDDGCFASALASVRRWGGVLEHPEASHAWRAFGLMAPSKDGGWVNADLVGGWTCCVEQGHYGHPARKATWLYAHGIDLPLPTWGAAKDRKRMDDGFHSTKERHQLRAQGVPPTGRLSRMDRIATPIPFRDFLISMVSR